VRDLHSNIKISRAISPVSEGGTTALVSQIIDTNGYDSLEFAIATGSLADSDATFAVLVEHSAASDMTGAAAVPDAELLGLESEAAFTFAADDSTRKIGYMGGKRYVRLTITPAANSGAAVIAAVAIQGHPKTAPVA
jgi:hypothetical protein